MIPVPIEVDLVEGAALFKIRQDQRNAIVTREDRHHAFCQRTASILPKLSGRRETLVRDFELQRSERHVSQMILTLRLPGSLTSSLDCRQQQRNQNANDRDHNQQLDERKTPT
jgi:hypothetical protein